MTYALYDYQREAIDASERELKEHDSTAVVLATGLGKTVVFAFQVAEYLERNPGRRVIIVVHTGDLVNQTVAKLGEIAPHLSVGVVKAGRNQVRADVIVASRQTLGKDTPAGLARRNAIRHVGRIVVDECHHAVAPEYRRILTHYKVKYVGYTATLERADGKGLGDVFASVAIERDILWGVRHHRLIMPRGKTVRVPDLHLATRRGDWSNDQLGDAMAESLAPRLVAEAYLEHAPGRKAIGFLPTVASAHLFADAFLALGVHTEVVHGGLSQDARDEIYARHKHGTVLLNCMVLTEGYDAPDIDCVIVGRPTKNRGLYIQMCGRGIRLRKDLPWADQDCLILNVTGVENPGLRSITDLSRETEGKPSKEDATLLDLTTELDAGDGVEDDPEAFWDGAVEVVEFDPLQLKSTKRWATTAAGLHYVPVLRIAWVALRADHGTDLYRVYWFAQEKRGLMVCPVCGPRKWGGHATTDCPGLFVDGRRRGGRMSSPPVPLNLAMAAAEDLAVAIAAQEHGGKGRLEKGHYLYGRPITKARMSEADIEGVKVPDHLVTDGEVSDLIDRVRASRVIDPWAAKSKEAK